VKNKGIVCEQVCKPGKRGTSPDLSSTHERTEYFDSRREAKSMSNPPPCVAWAEKLALRQEDLSPADRAALNTHVKTCPACQAAQADYHFLDARLQALPTSAMKPLPRLSPAFSLRDT